MDYNALRTLALKVTTNDVPANYTAEQLEDSLRAQLRILAPKSDYHTAMENKYAIFRLIAEVSDLILPKRVIQSLGAFAEYKQFAQNEKPIFTRKLGSRRGRSFITRVGLSGTYEAFRLDQTSFEVPTAAWGGAAYMELENYLDGHVTFNELLDIFAMGYEDATMLEVQKALLGCYANPAMPTLNKVSVASFDGSDMAELIAIISSYGNPNIFCDRMFAAAMVPFAGWANASEADKLDSRNSGYIGKFFGANVIVLPNSVSDESNTSFVLNPAVAFVIPSGEEKIVKIAAEGQTQVRDIQNADWSFDLQTYKKLGVGIMHLNQFGIYENRAIDFGHSFPHIGS